MHQKSDLSSWALVSTILEDLEQKVHALRQLHAKLRDMDAGESFAGVVARSRPV